MEPQQDTRRRILDEAWRLLREEGAEQVRMVDVARAAGVSRQAVYLHFGSRAGLLLALAGHVDDVGELQDLLAWVGDASSPMDLLQRVTRLQVLYNPRIDAVALAFQRAAPTDPEVAAAFQDRMDDRLQGMHRIVDRLIGWGALRPGLSATRAAELAWGILSLSVWRDLVKDRGWSPDEYCEQITTTLEGALLAAAARQSE